MPNTTTTKYVIDSHVRETLNDRNMRLAGDTTDTLNLAVHEILNRAIIRAKANGRKTVEPTDL